MVEDVGTNLLNKPTKTILNGSAKKDLEVAYEGGMEPPDGGTRAWLVMVGSFFCNGILFGVINSYSVLYAEFHDILKNKGSTNPSGEAGEDIRRRDIFRATEALCTKMVLYVHVLRLHCAVN
ncbi:hypothetical protein Zmor_001300 [Zophobas morio]|uniref:Uncharacterized protein n=1 Tax=Zophobas morio TaxID=2755281 RepID=A0AA38J504_9CUCU|nr:hypothetical protein Zmor_001300 [Zophobas morio]